MICLRLLIHGHVQGVFYRQSTLEKARELCVKGTVRNCDDGSVEAWIEGESEAVNKLIEWCRKGPRNAVVDHLDIHESPLKNFSRFSIIR